MPTAYTSLLGLALPVSGDLTGTWGDTVNNAITSLLDTAVAGTTTLSADADVTLTDTTGAANQARAAVLRWTANGSTTRYITAPARSKAYIVINDTTGFQSIVLRGVGPTTGVTIAPATRVLVVWNGSDFVSVAGGGGGAAAGATVNYQQFSGTGAQTVYTLAANPGGITNTAVFVNGAYQQKTTYSLVAATLTFTEAPPSGTNNIEVVTTQTAAIGSTDSSLVTFVPAGAGAVQRSEQSKNRDIISVRDYGAAANATTDDTAAFNAAHILASIVGGAVYVPQGAPGYRLVGPVNVLAPMYGDGINTLLIAGAATGDVLQVAQPNITLRDFAMGASVTRTANYFINFNGTTNNNSQSRCERLYMSNWFSAIGITGGGSSSYRVTNCVLQTNVPNGLGVLVNTTNDSQDIVVSNTYVLGPSSGAQPYAAAQVFNAGTITFDNFVTAWTGYSLAAVPQSGQTVSYLKVSKHHAFGQSSGGVLLQPAAGGTITHAKISDSIATNLTGNGFGLNTLNTGFVRRAELINCTATACTVNGVYFTPNCQSTQIVGGSYGGNSTGVRAAANASNFQIFSATIGGFGSISSNTFGIVIEPGTSTNYTIVGNNLQNNTTSALVNGSSASAAGSMVAMNAGYNPIAPATGSPAGSPYTFTCGPTPTTVYLSGGTVSSVLLEAQNLGITSGSVRMGPGQLLTVSYTVAPTVRFSFD